MGSGSLLGSDSYRARLRHPEPVDGWLGIHDHTQGKDRPVLLVGRDGPWLLGLQLTSRDHGLDASAQARHGRHWMDIGAGGWDAQRRPSEVRLDRVVRVDPRTVRREGAVLDRDRFDQVARAMARRGQTW